MTAGGPGGLGRGRRLALRVTGAGLLAAAGAIHLDLYLTRYRTIPAVGWLFLLQVITAFALAVAVLVSRSRLVSAAGAAFALATIGGYVLSVWVGLFGFTEVRTTAGISAGIIEVAAFAALGVLALVPAAPGTPAVQAVKGPGPAWLRAGAPGSRWAVAGVAVLALLLLGVSVARAGSPAPAASAESAPVHLPVPARMTSPAGHRLPAEGVWRPAGRLVGGIPAVYETRVRPDAVHTNLVIGVAWMDTRLLRPTLYSGSTIPGGRPFRHTAPISPTAASSLVAAFNAGFLMDDANGGYYTDGRTLMPLRNGAASFVIYRNGTASIADWGRDATLTPDIVSVRQNLDLLVDHGKPASGLNPDDTTQWGFTQGNAVYVWRSGVGITADGALVYVAGPRLNITMLADTLARAGAVRAMELDINNDWVNLATYDPPSATGQATPANGTDLLPRMFGQPGRYFQSWWSRDFFTMSATIRPPARGKRAAG